MQWDDSNKHSASILYRRGAVAYHHCMGSREPRNNDMQTVPRFFCVLKVTNRIKYKQLKKRSHEK